MIGKLSIRIYKDRIPYIVVLLLFLPIVLFKVNNYGYYIATVKIAVGFLFILLYAKKLRQDDTEAWLWIVYCSIYILPYIINSTLTIKSAMVCLYPIGYFLFIYYSFKEYPDSMINAMYDTAFILCILYILILIYYKATSNLAEPILTDNHNGIPKYMAFVATSVILRTNYYDKKYNLKDFFLILVSIIAVFLSGSTTGILAFAIGFIVLMLPKIIDVKYELIVYGVLFASIIVLRYTSASITQFIFSTFNKNATFTHRTWRWDFALFHIKNHLLTGNSNLEREASNFAGYQVDLFNPHNALLYILVYGGVFAAIIIVVLIIREGEVKYKYFTVFVAILLVEGLMESDMCPDSFVFATFLALTAGLLSSSETSERVKKSHKYMIKL